MRERERQSLRGPLRIAAGALARWRGLAACHERDAGGAGRAAGRWRSPMRVPRTLPARFWKLSDLRTLSSTTVRSSSVQRIRDHDVDALGARARTATGEGERRHVIRRSARAAAGGGDPRRHAPGAPAPTSRARRPAPTSRARRLPPTADGGGDRPPLRRRPRYRPPTARPRTSVRASRSRVAAVAVSLADRPTTPRDATPAADSGSGHARRRRSFRRRPPPPPA